jgi:hypothetical protein
MKTKEIFATAVLVVSSFTWMSSTEAATTKSKPKAKPTAADRRKAALIDLEARAGALFVKRNVNKTNVSIIATEGDTVYTGDAYRGVLDAEQRDLTSGIYYPNTTFESFNFRILSSSATAAVIRVCERATSTGAFYKKDDSPAVDAFPLVVADYQVNAVYSAKAKRWLFSKYAYVGDTEGKSKCADGK